LAEIRGRFAEEPGSHGKYFALFFAFSWFLGIFSAASHCLSTTSAAHILPGKITPENRWKVFASLQDVP
jgi:hypothetical protein